MAMDLVLASSSRYRRAQLASLGLQVEYAAPDIDESQLPGEKPADMARRLARSKAQVIAALRPMAVIIAADQVACVGNRILSKPGSLAAQRQQLADSGAQELHFYTALAVCRAADARFDEHLDVTCCRMRALTAADIDRYVAAEPAIDCAGGFKVEGLGILLFERIDSSDPTALIGLPLIAVGRLLRQYGWELP